MGVPSELLFVMLKIFTNALTRSALDWSSFKSLRNHYHKLILSAKKQYYVSSSSENLRRLWQTVSRLLHRKSSSLLPSYTSVSSHADSFASFFTDKIPDFGSL